MTTMYADTRTCKNCGQDSEQIILGSTNSFGSPDLDLRSPPMVRDTMDTWIQVCPHCKFCAPNIAKAKVPERPVTDPEYLAAFEDERFPELARRMRQSNTSTPPGSVMIGKSKVQPRCAVSLRFPTSIGFDLSREKKEYHEARFWSIS